MIIEVLHQGVLLAIILRQGEFAPGVNFVTQGDSSLQLATMRHPAGKEIQPHLHNTVNREIRHTNEVLIIRKGELRVDFFTLQQEYLHSRILRAGDVILLTENAAHGFEVTAELEMLEIKQGPYLGELDKTRFTFPANFTPAIIE